MSRPVEMREIRCVRNCCRVCSADFGRRRDPAHRGRPPTSPESGLLAHFSDRTQVENASATVRPAVQEPVVAQDHGLFVAQIIDQTRAFIQDQGQCPHSRDSNAGCKNRHGMLGNRSKPQFHRGQGHPGFGMGVQDTGKFFAVTVDGRCGS